MADPREHIVNPSRLSWASENDTRGRNTGNGDIYSSYSADTLAERGTIRKPFQWQGSLWVTVCMSGPGDSQRATAYRLIPKQLFQGTPATYAEKFGSPKRAQAARGDAMGAYHGMLVKHGRETFILCGPATTFLAGTSSTASDDGLVPRPAQLDLF
jgi:hypothetical protein